MENKASPERARIHSQINAKMKKIYAVFDATGTMLRTFGSYKEASTFCISRGRHDWLIKQINSFKS